MLTMSAYVAELYTYPIKGCAAMPQDTASIVETGLAYDRQWLLVDDSGNFLSQRRFPQLATVQQTISRTELVVQVPNFGSVSVALAADNLDTEPEQRVDFFAQAGTGRAQSTEANRFFSQLLGRHTRLLRSVQPRHVNEKYQRYGAAATIGFADAFPILLTSKQSLAAFNTTLDQPAPMDRFRANIVIDGKNLEPYIEDHWRKLALGDVQAFVVRACARCAVPDIDQKSGIRDSTKAVTKNLRANRHGLDRFSGSTGDFFGQNILPVYIPGMQLSIGNNISVLQHNSKANIQLD